LVRLFDPAKQKKVVDRTRQKNAAHMKPKAYLPMEVSLPMERNASRP
jgi:hypothetical protein